jgi:enolase
MKIASISACQIFDSRGYPTLEAEVVVENGLRGRAAVPSGASTGQFEALELRDGDPLRFGGKSVFHAIANVEGEIAAALRGCDVLDQAALDRRLIELDGTPGKSRLGANAILAVSMATARAAAAARGVPLYASLADPPGDLLPLPQVQIVGGGLHAHGRIDVQDFLFVPHGAPDYSSALEMVYNVYHAAGRLLRERGLARGVADEGGYWPEFDSAESILEFLVEAISAAGYRPGEDGSIALDIAASNLYDESSARYVLHRENRSFTSAEFADWLAGLCRRFPIVSIEDPMADTDWQGWSLLRQACGERLQVIADDLVTTNPARIREAIARRAANAVLIKLNQIGTVSETLEAIALVRAAGWKPVVSARSGETEDAFIAHLAVATNAGQIKVGSFSRGERMVKWNELLRIGRSLGPRARYVGAAALPIL